MWSRHSRRIEPQTVSMSILPRRSCGGRLVADPHRPHSMPNHSVEDLVSITDQVLRCLLQGNASVIGARPTPPSDGSLRRPGPGRGAADEWWQGRTAVWSRRWGPRTDPWPRCPGRDCAERRATASLAHVLRHSRLSDLEAELEQLTMDPRSSPKRVHPAHSTDQDHHPWAGRDRGVSAATRRVDAEESRWDLLAAALALSHGRPSYSTSVWWWPSAPEVVLLSA